MNSLRPIEIVGGGLAGLSLGLALRRADVPVTVVEAGSYPRHRVCGEFITGLSTVTITRLGLAPLLADAVPNESVAWFLREGRTSYQRLPSPALGLSRHALDARLAAAFVAAGGNLQCRTRAALGLKKVGRVLATGRRPGPPEWLGLKVHVRGLTLERDLEFHLGDEAYIGLSRIENQVVNACGLFRRRPLTGQGATLLSAYLHACGWPGLASRLALAEILPSSFCAVAALGFDRHSRQVPESICLGDAGAATPPFTGNGMAMAFQSAEAALEPLVRYARCETSWHECCRTTHTHLRRLFRLRLATADVLHPFLLRPRRQRWLSALDRTGLLPFNTLYAALH